MEPQTQNTSLFQLNVDANVGMALKGAASWARVLGILGIIFGIFFIGIGILLQTYANRAYGGFDDYGYQGGTASSIANVGMAMYIGLGAITIIGSIFPLSFGGRASAAIRANDANALKSSFNSLRNYFAFWSILMILGLLLMIIGVAGGSMRSI